MISREKPIEIASESFLDQTSSRPFHFKFSKFHDNALVVDTKDGSDAVKAVARPTYGISLY